MNRIALVVSGSLLVLLAAGCADGGKTTDPVLKEVGSAPAAFKVDPATAATVTGKVVFAGAKPAKKAIAMNEEAACVRLHKAPVYNEEVVVNKDGTLANVFVYVKTGLEGKTFEAAKDPIVIDQHGCMFRPRVFGIRVGQPLMVKNTDPVSHNIHPMPKDNREWNQQQAPSAPDLERQFARPEIMIPVKCNIHSWMKAFIGVVDHPYFAVIGETGVFELKGLPPGDYTLAAWQEKFGEQTQQVKLAASASQAVEFSFK